MTTHALDLARWLPTAIPAPGEAVVVVGAPQPFDAAFTPIASSAAALPLPTALGQVIESGASGQGFAWFATIPTGAATAATQVSLSPAVAGQTNLQAAAANLDGRITALNGEVEALIGVQRFVGALHAADATITWTADSGVTGNIPTAGTTNKGWYLICDTDGSLPATGAPSGTYVSGDWVISDGVVWTHLQFGSQSAVASQVAVNPAIAGAANVQAALTNLNNNFSLIPPSLADAPNDGVLYGRQSAAWTPIAGAGGDMLIDCGAY